MSLVLTDDRRIVLRLEPISVPVSWRFAMDVFRTGRRGRVVPLTEENYRRETNRKAPFVQMRGGHPSYFAVCPACGNPILICNLFKRTDGSRSANPYGRHYSASVPGVADYDETAYMFCPLSRNHSDPGNTRRTPTDKAGRELYALMRDQFDRYVYIWEKDHGPACGTWIRSGTAVHVACR